VNHEQLVLVTGCFCYKSGGIYLAYLPLSHVLELVAEISCLYLGLAIGYGSMSTLTTGRDGLASKCKGDIQILEPSGNNKQ